MATREGSPVAKRLKEARTAAGYSQKQLGIAAGIDEFSASARMNQYETGKHVPDFVTLKNIGSVLNVPPAYFYCDDDCLAELIRHYVTLDQDGQKATLNFVLSMTNTTD
ncbi:MAG: helix-turn-helix transcriptional regulator [Phycisphaerae bacterium]|nr:helix-turn-helix transcriptional regulator [Phycisphaerae bacterium]